MRRLGIFFLFLCSSFLAVGQQGYRIEVKLKQVKSGNLYLGNYYGKNTYLTDTAEISDRGRVVFKGGKTLPAGIYFILYPSRKKYFEFLVGADQHFTILADTTENFEHLRFEENEINSLFRSYNRFVATQHQKIIQAEKQGADSLRVVDLKEEVQDRIKNYRKKVIEQHPNTVLAALFKGMMSPEVPQKLKNNQEKAYQYTVNHFWNEIDFSDSSLVRSPILETRLDRFFNHMIPKNPDSINVEADRLLEKSEVNKAFFKYTLWWLTSNYERSKYMGMDAVFVHLVEKYYANGKAYWVKENQLQRIIGKAAKIAPNLIGKIAPEIRMETVDRERRKLSGIKAKYTVLVFWDPTCSHCQITIPKLDSAYQASWKKMGVKVVGILAGGTKSQWVEFIQKHHLEDWINLWDPENKSNYRRMYDVYQTPIIYLLGENKKILAKQISVEQLTNFLRREEKESPSS